MKQIKDLLVERLNSTNTVISERLILKKHASKEEYFFHKEIGVLFNNNTRMRLYSISTSENQEDRDNILGFVISSPFDLEYEDKLGREIGYKVGVALKYEDLENDLDEEILNSLIDVKIVTDPDDCFISYPGSICNSLSMQLPKIIAEELVKLLAELYNKKFFENSGFGSHFLKADWYTKKY